MKNENLIVPRERRESTNRKILDLIISGNMQGITKDDVFNSYTGIGGLHGLEFSDFDNRHEYSEAKKEIEGGQFFTPHAVSKYISNLINPNPTDNIIDLTCGIGNFFNYFKESNCYGCEIEVSSFKVAEFLYPNANIVQSDFRFYKSDVKFDYAIGNPPFNIKMYDSWSFGGSVEILSQMFYFRELNELLKPAAISIAIVPMSFCKEAFNNKSDIQAIDQDYNFIGQMALPVDTFKAVGVAKFETKVIVLQKRLKSIAHTPFNPTEFLDYFELMEKIVLAEEKAVNNKLQIRREILEFRDDKVIYKITKLLYDLSCIKKLEKVYDKALKYYDKYLHQKCPDDMKFEEWNKSHRITDNKMLSYLKKALSKQNYNPIEKSEWVKTPFGVKLKPYSRKEKLKVNKLELPFKELLFNNYVIDDNSKAFGEHKNVFNKKKSQYLHQLKTHEEIEISKPIQKFLSKASWLNDKLEVCKFNKVQRRDLNKVFQKQYNILAWQMGGGKTSATYWWSKYQEHSRNTFVVSASLALNLTWKPFLERNGESFIVIKKLSDIAKIERGQYILISFYAMSKLHRHLKKFIKLQSKKVSLIFDESDEITNYKSRRTKVVLSLFRNVKYKILCTGTTTRNNINELYPQLELLYNNSFNLISHSGTTYKQVKTTDGMMIKGFQNKYWNKPFPAFYGQHVFSGNFNPVKATVFGIKKNNQDLYNERFLKDLIQKTILTRKLKEIVGEDKFNIKNIQIQQDLSERVVYKKLLTEIQEVIPFYFRDTGNARKESALKLIRQIQLLIKATSVPQSFGFYEGLGVPQKAHKIKELLDERKDKIVAIGCVSKDAAHFYQEFLANEMRPLFYIDGEVSFEKRKIILKDFEASGNGILISTQGSLKSSVNVPSCDDVIIESLQWNIPRIEQYYFRFIRFDSTKKTNVIFINYANTIETNLLALLMAKEKLNEFIKTLETDEESVYENYDIDTNILDSLLTKEKDENGKVQVTWGMQSIA